MCNLHTVGYFRWQVYPKCRMRNGSFVDSNHLMPQSKSALRKRLASLYISLSNCNVRMLPSAISNAVDMRAGLRNDKSDKHSSISDKGLKLLISLRSSDRLWGSSNPFCSGYWRLVPRGQRNMSVEASCSPVYSVET